MKFHVGYTRSIYLKDPSRTSVPIAITAVEADSFTAAAGAAQKNGRVMMFVHEAVRDLVQRKNHNYSRAFALHLIRDLEMHLASRDKDKDKPQRTAKKSAPPLLPMPVVTGLFKRHRISYVAAKALRDNVLGSTLVGCQHKDVLATSRAAALKLYDTTTRVVFTVSELGRPGVKATLLKDQMTKANILRGRKRTLESMAAETMAVVTAAAEPLAAKIETATPPPVVLRTRVSRLGKAVVPAEVVPVAAPLETLPTAKLLETTDADDDSLGKALGVIGRLEGVLPDLPPAANSSGMDADFAAAVTGSPTIAQGRQNALRDFLYVLKATFLPRGIKTLTVWFCAIFLSLTLWTLLIGAVLGLYIRHGISMNGSELPTWVRLVYDL